MDVILRDAGKISLEEYVQYYHNIRPKLKYKEICTIISSYHRVPLTLRKLKEMCHKLKLNRIRNVSDADLNEIISTEMSTSSCNLGYRQLIQLLTLKYNVNVAKDTIRRILKDVDPAGVAERRRKTTKRRVYKTNGPGHVFHIDGNDKLKRWGFAIHGCMDGFSRKLSGE